jgi:hypothetical protein
VVGWVGIEHCFGKGIANCNFCHGDIITCETCQGTGKGKYGECLNCRGYGLQFSTPLCQCANVGIQKFKNICASCDITDSVIMLWKKH